MQHFQLCPFLASLFGRHACSIRLNTNNDCLELPKDHKRLQRRTPPCCTIWPKQWEMWAVLRWSSFRGSVLEESLRPSPSCCVCLQTSDYINGSFMDGYKRGSAYIATQGEQPSTVTPALFTLYDLHTPSPKWGWVTNLLKYPQRIE